MLNFNVSPYYDDFDPNKNYHRILFKPGYAVQARELTQSQTILQDQISKFADHVFQKNTPVSGAKVTYNTGANYIKLESTYNGAEIDVTQFTDQLIQNANGDVIAKVLAVSEESGITGGDPNTLIVSYVSGEQFKDGDIIYSTFNPNIVAQAYLAGATGSSSVVSISEGVFYVVNGFSLSQTTGSRYSIGHFVNVLPQTIVVEKYGIKPSVRVGLNITETVLDYIDDVALLDPADGAPNYQGPGADRYTISLDLETRTLQLGDDDGFIELMRIENGQVKKQINGTVYSVIDDYFAKRTFEESGDYIVSDFKVSPTTNSSNTARFDLNIGKGIAYVRGYRLENQTDITITGDRARDTATKTNDSTFINYGNFVYTTSANGFFDFVNMPAVDLHVVGSGSVSTSNTKLYNSTVASTARVRGLEVHQQTGAKNTFIYKTFLTDIENKVLSTTAKTGSNLTSVYLTDDGSFSTINDSYNGVKVSVTTGGITEFRKITKYYGSTKYFDVDTALSISPTTSSKVSIIFDIKDIESVVQVNKTSAPFKFVANNEISTLSRDNSLATGNTFISETVSPELIYPIGYPYISSIDTARYTTNYVFKNQSFGGSSATLSLNAGDPFQFLSTSREDYIVILSTGAVGNVANMSNLVISGDQKTLTFDVTGDLSGAIATVVAKVSVNDADNNQYVLKHKNLIEGDTSAIHISGTTVNTYTKVDTTYGHVYIQKPGLVTPGQTQSLYISDVKRIVKIIDTGDVKTPPTSEMLTDVSYDITNNFSFDNGQRDSYYGHASIKLKPGRPAPLGNILVVLDYYQYDTSSGDGYFSVRSYLSVSDGGVSSSPENYSEIPSYTARNGSTYSLRDCLDFRPTVQNAQANFTLQFHNNASYIPVNKDTFTANYDYYLARRDLLVLSKDKNFEIVKGTPAVNPLLPTGPDGSLVIAKLKLDPYTSYVPGETPRGVLPSLSIEKVKHKRWRMQDISDMEVRVNNIEYYTALNLLEKNAQGLQISDVNGLNRFKNGILVDDFSSFATADTGNLDFSANINRREKKLSAARQVNGFPLQNSYLIKTAGKLDENIAKSLGFKVNTIGGTNYFTLPYTTANIASQVLASNVININPFAVAVYEGSMTLNPPMDNWVDNKKQPDLLIVDKDLELYQSSEKLNTLSVGDWKTIPGTTTTSTSSSSTSSTTATRTAITTTTTTTTKTATYADLAQTTITGYYDKLGSTYNQEGGYITDISILPYIRAQQVLFRAKGLLINTPVKSWFDGQRVDSYITNPDVIELTNVYGNFNEDDTIGYNYDNKFFPIAKVAAVYKYPATPNRVRLYVYGNDESNFTDVNKIQNASFNTDGVLVGNTAFGTPVTTNTVISIHRSGTITSVGNNITDRTGTAFKFFKKLSSRYGAFNNKFGIWSTATGGNLYLTPNNGTVPANFSFDVPKTGTYYIKIGAEWSEPSEISSYQVYDSANNLISFTNDGPNTKKATLSLVKGKSNVAFRMTYNNIGNDNDNFFALAISSQPFAAGDAGTEVSNTLIFSTASLLTSNTTLNTTANIAMPGGGVYYTGVTQVSLSASANTTTDFYKNNKIKINSTNVTYNPDLKTFVVSPVTRTANIVSYVGANSTAFLDTAVPVSFGFNSYVNSDVTSTYSIDGTANNSVTAITQGTLSKMSTDEGGNFVGVFNIPEGSFRTGDRVFRIDNRSVDTDPGSATTVATSTFTASGLSTQSQSINFAPSIDSAKKVFSRTDTLKNQLISSNTSTETVTRVVRQDPVCQSFLIEENNFPNGAFINSIKLFFASKPSQTSTPVTLSIVGTLNGYPNGETLPNSIVTLQAGDIKTSTTPHYLDPNTYTEFTFKSPIYIQPGVLYAVLLQSPSNEYNVYLAAQNATALKSSVKNLPTDPDPSVTTKIGTTPYFGALFESQNGLTWTADQGKALMFVMERCVFDITKQPTIPFVVPNGLPFRKLTGQEVRSFYDANNISNLFGVAAGNDILSDAYNLTTTDFVPSATSLRYNYQSILNSDKSITTATPVSPGKFGCPTYDDIYLNDGKGERVLIANSNTSFIFNASLSSSDNTVSPIISDDGTTLYNITMYINNLGLSNDSITLVSGGVGYNVETTSVTISEPDDINGTQAYGAVDISDTANGIISQVYITNPGSGYWTTPTITISGGPRINAQGTIWSFSSNTKVLGTGTYFLTQLANNVSLYNTNNDLIGTIQSIESDTSLTLQTNASYEAVGNTYFTSNTDAQMVVHGETSSTGGNALARYVTKKVVLPPGNDSGDLRVYYTAYRPSGTNILVYYKLLNRNDTQTFEDSEWQLMTNVGNDGVYSRSREDLYEYISAPGTNNVADDYISYTSSNGQTYTNFSQFAIKIVMTTIDNTNVPFLTDLRAIALPSGTGF